MKFDKKYIVVLSIMVVLIIGLLIYYFSMDNAANNIYLGNGNYNNTVTNNTGGNTTNIVINNNPTLVEDYNVYFTINSLINNYYQIGIDEEASELINLVDKEYITLNGLNTSNVVARLRNAYDEATYYSKLVYEKQYGNLKYYFIEGEVQEYDFANELLYERENISFLFIADDSNDTYSITPLGQLTNIMNYANNYVMNSSKKISSNGYNAYSINEYNTEFIAKFYLNYFKNMLYLNTEKAYGMLENNYKMSFGSLENFTNNLDTIFSNIKINAIAVGTQEQNGTKVYSLKMPNNMTANIYEESIMNFKVTIQ